MEQLLTSLRALGVHIPTGLSEEQLLRLAKKLCPWRLTVEPIPNEHGMPMHRAYTRKDLTGDVVESSVSATHAAYTLLLQQMEAGKYTALDTQYKQNAEQFRATNP